MFSITRTGRACFFAPVFNGRLRTDLATGTRRRRPRQGGRVRTRPPGGPGLLSGAEDL